MYTSLLLFMFIVYLFLFNKKKKWFFEKGTLSRMYLNHAKGSFVRLSQGMTHYVLSGPLDGEIVVFIHGLSLPSEAYLAVGMEKYYTDAGFRFLTFDLYGRGYSESPDTKYTPELLTNQLVELLFALGIKKPVHLIGLSMGGAVASYFAKAYPEKAKKLALVSSVGYGLGSNSILKLIKIPIIGEFIYKTVAFNMIVKNEPNQMISSFVKIFDPEFGNNEEQKPTKNVTQNQDCILAFDISAKHVKENIGLIRTVYSTLKNFPLDNISNVIQDISSNPRKVLIIHGNKDNTVSHTSAVKMNQVLKNSTFLTLEGGHDIIIEKKQPVHSKIIQFLQDKEI